MSIAENLEMSDAMDYIEHHGILGMHLGIRRYQNKDGLLTSAGRARLAKKDEKGFLV